MRCFSYLCQVASLCQHFLGLFRQLPLLQCEHLQNRKASLLFPALSQLPHIDHLSCFQEVPVGPEDGYHLCDAKPKIGILSFQTYKWGIEVKQFIAQETASKISAAY